MQIPILNGIYTDDKLDYRIAYPVNMRPILKSTGISEGYLRPVDGVRQIGEGPGLSRGAINWNDEHYRVMGPTLCKIEADGTVTEIGDVQDDGKQVSMAYSFDRLAIASNRNLFYYDGSTITQVTDTDLGAVVDMTWIDGYFMTTDGEFLVVTDLSNPLNVNPLKYTGSEIDPDPIVAILKLRNEIYAVNRYTIEVFRNVGGQFFPFQRVTGAQIQKGALGTHCTAVYMEQLTFLGSSPGESPGIFAGGNGQAAKISSREVDDLLENYTEAELSEAVFEVVNDRSHPLLWVRLPDRTLVFDGETSKAAGIPIWYIMNSGEGVPFRGVDVIWCYDDWQCADSESALLGVLDDQATAHFGARVEWEFSTQIIYGEGKGGTVHQLELVGLPGRTSFGDTAYISTSYSLDGMTWSQPRTLDAGTLGNRNKRMVWRRQGSMRNYRIQRFTGSSDAYISFSRLEADIERHNA
jgi:hypothetical protein